MNSAERYKPGNQEATLQITVSITWYQQQVLHAEMQVKGVYLPKALIPSFIKKGTNFILHIYSE